MAKQANVSHLFRKRLKGELATWREADIVTELQARQITDRYRLDGLKRESVGILMTTIYVIGAILIACGVVSFVAYHWDEIGRWPKVAMLVGAMLAAHGAGLYFWQLSGSRPKLGHAMLILGTLIFGANIGLMAQIFHIQSDYYNGYGAFAIGALAMAWASRSTPLAVFALIGSFVWFVGWQGDYQQTWCYYPFLLAIAVMPLVYVKRSAFAFTLMLAALGIALLVHASVNGGTPLAAALTGVVVGELFLAWGLLSARTEHFTRFCDPAVVIGAISVVILAYALSFREVAEGIIPYNDPDSWLWAIPTGVAALAATAAWGRVLIRPGRGRAQHPPTWGILIAGVLPMLAIVAQSDTFLVIAANVAVFVACVGLCWGGVSLEDRRVFWCGVILSAALIIGRFLEYDTNLIVKSIAFLACGAGVIASGVVFENYLRRQRPGHEQEG